MAHQISAKSCILIFPQLSLHLIEQLNCVIVGSKRADYKLFDVINSGGEIPHVMKYDLTRKAWESFDSEELIINILDDVEFVYQYPKLIKNKINYLLSFMNLYSSAKLELLR